MEKVLMKSWFIDPVKEDWRPWIGISILVMGGICFVFWVVCIVLIIPKAISTIPWETTNLVGDDFVSWISQFIQNHYYFSFATLVLAVTSFFIMKKYYWRR